jgi:hypothetical protein
MPTATLRNNTGFVRSGEAMFSVGSVSKHYHEFQRGKLVDSIDRGYSLLRMTSSGMLCRVALVRTDVSEELSAFFIRVTRIGELGPTLAVTSIVPSSPILVTLMKEALSFPETSVLTRAARHNISEDAILHSHRRENLKSYTVFSLQMEMGTLEVVTASRPWCGRMRWSPQF